MPLDIRINVYVQVLDDNDPDGMLKPHFPLYSAALIHYREVRPPLSSLNGKNIDSSGGINYSFIPLVDWISSLLSLHYIPKLEKDFLPLNIKIRCPYFYENYSHEKYLVITEGFRNCLE